MRPDLTSEGPSCSPQPTNAEWEACAYFFKFKCSLFDIELVNVSRAVITCHGYYVSSTMVVIILGISREVYNLRRTI